MDYLEDLLQARAAFVILIKKENFEDRHGHKQSLKKNWAGPQFGFYDHMLNQRWLHFFDGWKAATKRCEESHGSNSS